ncbi:MAG TPA: tetratricopeptide repeat protein, partial [Methanosarcina sp.]|nr:tetratricopeptide repeat protein [Methanosarcina sp.]
GVVCFKQKLYETAAKAFKEALTINPWHEQSLRYLGISLAKIGEYDEALKAFEKLLRINPHDVQSMNYRGVILGKMERFGEAIRAFDEILRVYPDMEDAREKLEVLKSLENEEHFS